MTVKLHAREIKAGLLVPNHFNLLFKVTESASSIDGMLKVFSRHLMPSQCILAAALKYFSRDEANTFHSRL